MHGFASPYRLYRNSNGGGISLYIRENTPSKILEKVNFEIGLDAMLIKNNITKSKWLLNLFIQCR